MAPYDYNTTTYTSSAYPQNRGFSPTKMLGGALLGGTLGMAAYYIPVNKNAFVNEAFKVTKKNTEADIVNLKVAANEVKEARVTNESKILLQRLGVAEDFDAIINKCKTLHDSVNDSAAVKNLKSTFETGFDGFKKQASLMDNNAAEAMRNIKWRGFNWGMLIGAVSGLALGMLNSRD